MELFITSFSHRPTTAPVCNYFGGMGLEAVVANGAARWGHGAEILSRHGGYGLMRSLAMIANSARICVAQIFGAWLVRIVQIWSCTAL